MLGSSPPRWIGTPDPDGTCGHAQAWETWLRQFRFPSSLVKPLCFEENAGGVIFTFPNSVSSPAERETVDVRLENERSSCFDSTNLVSLSSQSVPSADEVSPYPSTAAACPKRKPVNSLCASALSALFSFLTAPVSFAVLLLFLNLLCEIHFGLHLSAYFRQDIGESGPCCFRRTAIVLPVPFS